MPIAIAIIIIAAMIVGGLVYHHGVGRTMIWIGIHMLANSQSLIRAGQDWNLREKQREADLQRLEEEYL